MLLVDDHVELDGMLGQLIEALGEGDAERAFARLDLFWARLAMHIRAEHLHLFPSIISAVDGPDAEGKAEPSLAEEARSTIALLRDDHDFFMDELATAVKAMRELRAASGGERRTGELQRIREAILSLKNRLELHNRLEEERIYPLPAMLLEAAAQSALAAQMKREIENLPPRFQSSATNGQVSLNS